MKKNLLFLVLCMIFIPFVFPGERSRANATISAIGQIHPNEKPLMISAASSTNSEFILSVVPQAGDLNLGELILLDKLFDKNNQDLLQSDGTTIGDLLILNAIFNEHDIGSPDNAYSLGDLFVLDELFDHSGSPQLSEGYTSISDLMILDRLFND